MTKAPSTKPTPKPRVMTKRKTTKGWQPIFLGVDDHRTPAEIRELALELRRYIEEKK